VTRRFSILLLFSNGGLSIRAHADRTLGGRGRGGGACNQNGGKEEEDDIGKEKRITDRNYEWPAMVGIGLEPGRDYL
jgi:hypothetical protein